MTKRPRTMAGHYGWKVNLDHKFKQDAFRFGDVRPKQVLVSLKMGLRYGMYILHNRFHSREPFIDLFGKRQVDRLYGVPIGGLGCGTIMRGWNGQFCRWQLRPGWYTYDIVHADQFTVSIRKNGEPSYQQVLSPCRPSSAQLGDWFWGYHGSQATYRALYPRAWTTYNLPGQNVTLTCRQISPIIPHNYKDSCLPVGCFIWEIDNQSDDEIEVSIMFTFQNGDGSEHDSAGGHQNETFTRSSNENMNNSKISGVLLHHRASLQPCTFTICAKECPEDLEGKSLDSYYLMIINILLSMSVLLQLATQSPVSKKGEIIGAAVATTAIVKPQGKAKMEFALTWDQPEVYFDAKEIKYRRRYTRFFNPNGSHRAADLAVYALQNVKSWEEKIDQWQSPILENESYPDWYKSAIFNELYYMSDSGSIWAETDGDEDDETNLASCLKEVPGKGKQIHKEYGRFAYLEGHEYLMYNTYDVHFYASFALAQLWPMIELSIQYDFAASIMHEDPELRLIMWTGLRKPRKSYGFVPHDIGEPCDEPWKRINAYCISDVQDWTDLNTKFVLQIYRDYCATGNLEFLKDMWPCAKHVMETAISQDTDGDGIIDNNGADQTYDVWRMYGASAYCGGIFLAALYIMYKIADLIGCKEDKAKYSKILLRGRDSFQQKLWNGEYYLYDSSKGNHSDSIMADQMCGHWYLQACGLVNNNEDDIFPKSQVDKALRKVFDYNVMKFMNGTWGAVNGMKPNGEIDTSSVQSEEVWTGVTYALAANLIQQGMIKEGFKVAEGMYDTTFNVMGLGFQTPEAYYKINRYRCTGYMRPLSIWAIEWAFNHVLKKNTKKITK
ncbi:Non-lysosomal glucosylceramidase [Trichoplax sp. H2]|nr:Non-lysosomal glucosylceramidase [Trichoplax sp. H2]|eukprot:RDD46384.1 Non-lysosomal glucosylceramidase [Trichoplax sp. H2]